MTRAVKTLRLALDHAVRYRLGVTENAARVAETPVREPKKIQFWSLDEAREFVRLSAHHRLCVPFWLMLTTGMRRGEMVALRWQDIDLDAPIPQITINHQLRMVGNERRLIPPKGGSTRILELSPREVEWLGNHWQTQAGEFGSVPDFLCSPLRPERFQRGPYVPTSFASAFRDLVVALGLRPIPMHGLRHTAATIALTVGVHPKIVQVRLGHASINITMDLYTHVPIGLQGAAAAEVMRAIRSQPPPSAP